MPGWTARAMVPAAGLLMLALLLGLYLSGNLAGYHAFLGWHGIPLPPFPFLDTAGNLAAWECARMGIDVIDYDPCDVLGRSYNYTPFWMTVAFIPLGNADRVVSGLVLNIGFLISLYWLAPPRWGRDTLLMVSATVSSAIVFALDRANPDLLLYLILLPAVALLRHGTAARWLGYILIWLTVAVKYYPAVVLVLALRERRAMLAAVTLASALLALIYAAVYHVDAARMMALIPQGPPDVLLFGAKNLPIFLGREAGLLGLGPAIALPVALLSQIFLVIACLRRALRWLRAPGFRAALAAVPDPPRLLFIGCCAIMAGCFFAGQSIVYRGIFFMPVLAGLLHAANTCDDPPWAARMRRFATVIVLLMWSEGIRVAIMALPLPGAAAPFLHAAIVIARELAWWWVIAGLIAVVLDFVLRTQVGQPFARRLLVRETVHGR